MPKTSSSVGSLLEYSPFLQGESTRSKRVDTAEMCCVSEAQKTSFDEPIRMLYVHVPKTFSSVALLPEGSTPCR